MPHVIIERDFESYFNTALKPFIEVKQVIESEAQYWDYIKKVLYFVKDVIQPLEKKGMRQNDTIIDIASGDGQMSLALALLGYKNVTLFDLDTQRLQRGINMINLYCPETDFQAINDSATNFAQTYDILISYQTIEHLSDEGNYSVAKKKCQIKFLTKVNKQINKLCYFNAPNRSFPIDGHDTGKPFFHLLPTTLQRRLINNKIIKCSWDGICRPITISFLNEQLTNFRLSSSYYAFDSMIEYLHNRPSFDYMGNPIYRVDTRNLSGKKTIINLVSLAFGKGTQRMLPVLSVIYKQTSLLQPNNRNKTSEHFSR